MQVAYNPIVVVVGYGQQKKASVVGATAQTTGETLQRAGGVSNVGAALTGNLPGTFVTAFSGYKDDTIGTLHTINSSCRCILQSIADGDD